MNHFKEKAMKCVFLIAACTSVLAVFLICAFLFANGIPAIGKIGPLKFLLGTKWKPSNDIFGILPMIVASIYVTAGAILLGVPIALFTSVFMARYCPKKIYRPLKSGIELMAGVPSIVYGFFGLILIVPLIRQIFGGTGTSMLAACVLLGMMILPTIIGRMPKILLAGFHVVPDRNAPKSYFVKNGSPFRNRKTQISATAAMENAAVAAKTQRMTCSLTFMSIDSFFLHAFPLFRIARECKMRGRGNVKSA